MVELGIWQSELVHGRESYQRLEPRITFHLLSHFCSLTNLPTPVDTVTHFKVTLNEDAYSSLGDTSHRDITVLELHTILVGVC